MKNERKQNIIEAALFPIIADLISTTVHVSEVWNTVKNTIERSSNENKLTNIISDYGITYKNTIYKHHI